LNELRQVGLFENPEAIVVPMATRSRETVPQASPRSDLSLYHGHLLKEFPPSQLISFVISLLQNVTIFVVSVPSLQLSVTLLALA
jgi:hypothetical protein